MPACFLHHSWEIFPTVILLVSKLVIKQTFLILKHTDSVSSEKTTNLRHLTPYVMPRFTPKKWQSCHDHRLL